MHTFVEELLAISQQHADRPGLVCDGATWTYQSLFERAQRLACHLKAHGVRAGDRVAFWGRRHPQDYVHILAIWWAGAAYVPLGTLFGAERNARILAAAQVGGVLFSPSDRIPIQEIAHMVAQGHAAPLDDPSAWHGGCFLDWDQARDFGDSCFIPKSLHSPLAVAEPTGQTDLAYLIFTSGSTGEPKGVPIGFGALAQYLLGMQSLYPLDATDRVSQMAQLSFDASVHELFWTWRQGACLCVMPDHATLLWPRYAQDQQLTCMLLVPSSVHLAEKARVLHNTQLPGLRLLFLGAEAVTDHVVRSVHRVAPQAQLVNLWGPTESTIFFTHYPIDPEGPLLPVTPIGWALPGQELMLDYDHADGSQAQRADAPPSGEILQRGSQVMQGYWQSPSLNAERFCTRDAKQWYRSGDLAYRDPQHGLVFMGRKDRQIKIKGYRVELGAIEATVRTVSGASQVAVVWGPATADPASKLLVCYLVAKQTPDADQLGQIAARLPVYMVPQAYHLLQAMPLSANGKVDYRALQTQLLNDYP